MDKDEIEQEKSAAIILAIDCLLARLPDVQQDRREFLVNLNAIIYFFNELKEMDLADLGK